MLPVHPRVLPPASVTFTVNTTTDTHDATPTPGNPICSDSVGNCSLRAAMEEANALGTAVAVIVPAGTYNLTIGALLASDSGGIQITATAGFEQDCTVTGTPAPFPVASVGGNTTGDTTCGFTTSTDRQGVAAQGYWMTASDDGMFAFNTGFFGSMGGQPLNKPIVGMTPTSGNQGYWEVASDGSAFLYGSAMFRGSMGGEVLNKPVVGASAT
jgi:CSLREA domain-containing protein